jgi:hypothetical protein
VTFASLNAVNVTSGRNRPVHVTFSARAGDIVERNARFRANSTLTALSAVNVE